MPWLKIENYHFVFATLKNNKYFNFTNHVNLVITSDCVWEGLSPWTGVKNRKLWLYYLFRLPSILCLFTFSFLFKSTFETILSSMCFYVSPKRHWRLRTWEIYAGFIVIFLCSFFLIYFSCFDLFDVGGFNKSQNQPNQFALFSDVFYPLELIFFII